MRMRQLVNSLANTTQVYEAQFFHGTNPEDGGSMPPQIEAENLGD